MPFSHHFFDGKHFSCVGGGSLKAWCQLFVKIGYWVAPLYEDNTNSSIRRVYLDDKRNREVGQLQDWCVG